MDSFKKYLDEVMAGPGMGDLNLSKSQKRVLQKIDAVTAGGEPPEAETGEIAPEQQEEMGGMANDDSGNLAAQAIINSEDNRNLMAAVKSLKKYGYLETQPSELGPDDEPFSITLTDKGNQAIEAHGIRDDQALVSPEEQQQGAPQTPPPSDDMGMGGSMPPPSGGMGGDFGGAEGELGGEPGPESELDGKEGEIGAGELGDEEDLGNEEGKPEEKGNIKGKGVSLELSSFFQNVHDLSKFIKS